MLEPLSWLCSASVATVIDVAGKALSPVLMSQPVKDWAMGCLKRAVDTRKTPGNHDLLRGVRRAHLTALKRIALDHQQLLDHMGGPDVRREGLSGERDFARRLGDYLDQRLTVLSTRGIDHDALGPSDVANALEHLIQHGGLQTLPEASRSARLAAIERALAELSRQLLPDEPLPPLFVQLFKGESGKAGWYDIFGIYVAEQIKTEPRFQAIFFAAELTEIRRVLATVEAGVGALLQQQPELQGYLTEIQDQLRQIGEAQLRHGQQLTGLGQALDSVKTTVEGLRDTLQTGLPAFRWPRARDFSVYIHDYGRDFTGRVWLTRRVLDWLQSAPEQALLLLAPFGVGKSAFMAHLARTLTAQGMDTVVHFCRFDEQDDLRPGQIVKSLAAQFKDRLPAYKAQVESDADAQRALSAADTDPALAWSRAIVDPLVALGLPQDVTRLVLLVDGLDESLEVHENTTDHGGSLLELILKGTASRLPHWLRIVTSSRDVRQLGAQTRRFKVIDMVAEGGTENRQDLETYIRDCAQGSHLQGLMRQAAMDEDAFVAALSKLCDGKFLLAQYLLQDARRADFTPGDLSRVLQRSSEIPGMDAYYEWVFSTRVKRARTDAETTRAVLGLVAVALMPLSEVALADVLAPEGIGEDAVGDVVAALGGLLRFDERNGVTFDHLSVEQWLDKSRAEGRHRSGQAKAGAYAIDRSASMQRLQRHCLRTAALPYPVLVQRQFDVYLSKYGVVHLVDAGEVPVALSLLLALPLDAPAPRRTRSAPPPPPPPRRLEARVIDAIRNALLAFDQDASRTPAMLEQLDAGHLQRLLRSRDYETGKYQPVIRTLIQFKPEQWKAMSTGLLRDVADDLVMRNDIGVAYAEAWHSRQGNEQGQLLQAITAMARNSGSPDEREIAGYALKHICQKIDPEPWWSDIAGTVRELAAGYALSSDAVDRMVAGEMLLALALQGVPVLGWFKGEAAAQRFWQPAWPNLRMDIEAIWAQAGNTPHWVGPAPGDLQASFAAAMAQRDLAAALGRQMLQHPLFDEKAAKPNLSRLCWAVGKLEDQQCDKVALDEALEDLTELLDRPECHDLLFDVIRRLMLHPSWDLTESGASLLADLIKRKGRSNGPWWLIERLLESEPALWRLHYGAVDAAFNAGGVDGYQCFRRAVLKVGKMNQCRVRGICADDLRMWIKKASAADRRQIIHDPAIRDLLQCWLQTADDTWLLEYLHLMLSEVHAHEDTPAGWVQALLPDRLSHYLLVDPQRPFYELDADNFLSAIENMRQAEMPPAPP